MTIKLKYCSITGADDEINFADLNALAASYPFAEWAILWLPSRAGTPRFPKAEWIRKFSHERKSGHAAMHLCGDGLLDFIAGKKETLDLMRGFRRIQLNLKFGDIEGKYDPAKLLARVKESPQWDFIIQYAKDKKTLLPLLASIPNHAVLFDESAGRGISPDSWDAPLSGHFCGYAGGMNPDNVKANIDMISKVAPGYTTWIDMESGVRTNDRFDLTKTRRVLETAKPYAI